MLIVCPSCASSYDVEAAVLEPNGRQVRCVRCRAIWLAEPSRADKLLAAAAALGPDSGEEIADVLAGPDRTGAARVDAIDPTDWAVQLGHAEPGREADGRVAEAAEAPADGTEPAEVDAPPIVPAALEAGRPPIDVAADPAAVARPGQNNDVESYAARFVRRAGNGARPLWSLTRLQTAILALLVVDAIIVGWRRDIVRALPQTASLYASIGLPVNLRGLAFDAVKTSTEQHEGVPILLVEGGIVNRTGAVVDVPRLKLIVRNAARQEIYSWTAASPRATLAPYQAVGFRSRLASPPPEAADVLVRFINRRDIVAEPR